MAITHLYDPQHSHAYAVNDATGTASSSGANTLIAAPGAGYRLKLLSVTLQKEATDATVLTVLLKRGSTTFRRIVLVAQGDGYDRTWPVGRERRLGENEALVVDLSSALTLGYSIEYEIEAV